MLVVFEGPDAVGKNEMSTRLTEEINKSGRSATRISFPRYETLLGKTILRHLKNEISLREPEEPFSRAPEDALMFQCMMVADKYHAASEISKLLARGVDVVCDRYWQSAYAFGGSDGLDEQWLLDIHDMMPKPDLNILLTLSPEEALKRRPKLRDRYEMDRETQVKVRKNYEVLWKMNPPESWRVVDAGRSKDDVFAEVVSISNERRLNLADVGEPYVMGKGRYLHVPSRRRLTIMGRGASSLIVAYDDNPKERFTHNVSVFGKEVRSGEMIPIDGTWTSSGRGS